MAEKKKKTGGRKKGTPNRTTSLIRNIFTQKSTEYFDSGDFDRDFADLDPKDKISVMEKIVSYIVPKPQTISLDVAEGTKLTIEDRLRELGGEDDE